MTSNKVLGRLRTQDTTAYEPTTKPAKWGGCRVGDGFGWVRVKDLDLDTDGADDVTVVHWEKYHQSQTSLDPSGKVISSVGVPYVVFPGWFAQAVGIALGSVCVVLDGDRDPVYAVFADYGPRKKIGEGSIALHRALGHETVKSGRIKDESLGRDVRIVFFPGQEGLQARNANDVALLGATLLSKVIG